jgi:hypothetical protein
MPIPKDKPFALFCSCSSPEHTVLVYPDSEEREVYLSLQMNRPSLLTRVKYLLGLSPWSGYVEVVLGKDSVEDLKKILKCIESWE